MRGRALLPVAALVLLAGCGTGSDQDQARDAAQGLYRAVHTHHGDGACSLLSPSTAQALAQQEKKPCAKAVVDVSLQGTNVTDLRVYQTDAVAIFDGGERAFLGRTAEGWRVSAAGCKTNGHKPADCEVQD